MNEQIEGLLQWYQGTELGKVMAFKLENHLKLFSKHHSCQYALQLGPLHSFSWLSSFINSRNFSLSSELKDTACDVQCDVHQLPIAHDSVNIILMPHLFELFKYPYSVLFEASRVLTPEGYLIYVGFNPMSISRLFAHLPGWDKIPLRNHWLWVGQLRHWLGITGFQHVSLAYLSSCQQKQAHFSKLNMFYDQMAQLLYPELGLLYVLIAKKREHGMRPIKLSWSLADLSKEAHCYVRSGCQNRE